MWSSGMDVEAMTKTEIGYKIQKWTFTVLSESVIVWIYFDTFLCPFWKCAMGIRDVSVNTMYIIYDIHEKCCLLFCLITLVSIKHWLSFYFICLCTSTLIKWYKAALFILTIVSHLLTFCFKINFKYNLLCCLLSILFAQLAGFHDFVLGNVKKIIKLTVSKVQLVSFSKYYCMEQNCVFRS